MYGLYKIFHKEEMRALKYFGIKMVLCNFVFIAIFNLTLWGLQVIRSCIHQIVKDSLLSFVKYTSICKYIVYLVYFGIRQQRRGYFESFIDTGYSCSLSCLLLVIPLGRNSVIIVKFGYSIQTQYFKFGRIISLGMICFKY